MHDALTLAYLAGVIDSDGHITVHRSTRLGVTYYAARIGIGGTRREPHDLAASRWGGKVSVHRPRNPRYRPQYQWSRGSPERAGDERHTCSEPGELDLVARTSVFWCHDGMRKVVAWRHATLPIEVRADGDFYKPPIAARAGLAVPYRADGTAGVLCAGWAAAARVAGGRYAWLTEEAVAVDG